MPFPRAEAFGSTVAVLVFHDPHQCTSDRLQSNRNGSTSAANLKFLPPWRPRFAGTSNSKPPWNIELLVPPIWSSCTV